MTRVSTMVLFSLLALLAALVLLNVLTRTAQNQDNVTYDQAMKLLRSGQVKTIGQTHSRLVILDLKNGTTLRTHEPRIDMIQIEYANCGEPCKNTMFWTE